MTRTDLSRLHPNLSPLYEAPYGSTTDAELRQKALVAEAGAGAFRTYGEAQGWSQREYGVTYSYPGTYAVLARFWVHPKVPRPRAVTADPEAQAA
ncbi:MAG: winged helix-turn-helix domain-containing protein [Dehalococcoidia bacterium]|nr:winged helix-turn-helix domain-containing protein [Dehalococcoidia bacterium]